MPIDHKICSQIGLVLTKTRVHLTHPFYNGHITRPPSLPFNAALVLGYRDLAMAASGNDTPLADREKAEMLEETMRPVEEVREHFHARSGVSVESKLLSVSVSVSSFRSPCLAFRYCKSRANVWRDLAHLRWSRNDIAPAIRCGQSGCSVRQMRSAAAYH